MKTRKEIKKEANKYLTNFCKKLHEPKDLQEVWKTLSELGIDVPMIIGLPHSVSEYGMKQWLLEYSINDKIVDDSYFVYCVDENKSATKNEYLIYLS